jgi:hypothetical protein
MQPRETEIRKLFSLNFSPSHALDQQQGENNKFINRQLLTCKNLPNFSILQPHMQQQNQGAILNPFSSPPHELNNHTNIQHLKLHPKLHPMELHA